MRCATIPDTNTYCCRLVDASGHALAGSRACLARISVALEPMHDGSWWVVVQVDMGDRGAYGRASHPYPRAVAWFHRLAHDVIGPMDELPPWPALASQCRCMGIDLTPF